MKYSEVLRGGDPRTLVGVAQVLTDVRTSPTRLGSLIDCCSDPDPVVRMRAADALEKYAREQPGTVAGQLDRILDELGPSRQPSVQWHLAQIVGEVPLTSAQHKRAAQWLCQTLEEATDWIVLSHALTALAVVAHDDPRVRPVAIERIERHAADPRKAVAKRAAKARAALG